MTSFSITHTIPSETIRATASTMADRSASYGGDPNVKSFTRAAAYIEIAMLREALYTLNQPRQIIQWTQTREGAVEVTTIFETEADRDAFATAIALRS
jgi:hypothetical protein